MLKKKWFLLLLLFLLSSTAIIVYRNSKQYEDRSFVTYRVNPAQQNIKFFWKNNAGLPFGSIDNLRLWLKSKNQTLLFAMNGGMYNKDQKPQGLYIEDHKVITQIDTLNGEGNFYLQPNGIFYITDKNIAGISVTTAFDGNKSVKCATQSGPMLVINGRIHPDFMRNSKNLNIRNGVGILPDNEIVFAMSKKEINFYDFAKYFQSLGCQNALYLDGLVSRTYLPEKNWLQIDGKFGVIIAVSESIK